MAAGAVPVGAGVVQIIADQSKFDAAMKALPATAQQRIDVTMRAMQERIAKKQLAIDIIVKAGGSGNLEKLQGELDILQRRLNNVKLGAIDMGNGLGAGIKGGGGAQALYQLGAAVDDLQYGFRGIMNNIPQIVVAFGHAGLAGAVAIAVTAVYQLYTHWNDLMNVMGFGKVRTEAEEMKELADQTARTATEQDRLNKLKLKEKTVKELQEARTPEQEKSSNETLDAIKSQGQGLVHDAMAKAGIVPEEHPNQRRDELLKSIPKMEADVQASEEAMNGPWYNKPVVGGQMILDRDKERLKEARKELDRIRKDEIEAFEADVANNVGGRRESLIKDVEANPEKYGKGKTKGEKVRSGLGFAQKLRDSSPEAVKKKEEQDKADKEFDKQVRSEIDEEDMLNEGVKEAKEKVANEAKAKQEKEKDKQKSNNEKIAREGGAVLAKGSAGTKLLGNANANITNDAVAYLLARFPGMSLEDAVALAPKVAAQAKGDVREAVAKKQSELGASTTPKEAAAAILKEEALKKLKKADADFRKDRESSQRVDDAGDRVEDARDRIRKAFTGGQKSSVMDVHSFINQQMTSSLNGEDRQRELIDSQKELVKAEQQLRDAIVDKAMLIAEAAP
jgi:hypothetical protein